MIRAYTTQLPYEKIAVLGLASLSLVLFVLYVYLLSASIVHVVIRKEVSQELTTLRSEISELENEYIEAQHQVSRTIASMQGYQEISTKVFIDRTPSSLVFSNN